MQPSLQAWASQAAALAFLSDLRCSEVASYAHQRTRQVAMHTSLDHTLYFHSAPPQPLGWVLVQLEAPWAADGRAVVRMKMWSPEGELLATAVQEALLRTEPRTRVGAAPAGLAAGGGYDQNGPPHTSSKL
jgi:acyl-CoA thioesterase II